MGEPAWGAAGRIPTEERSSVSTEQRGNLDAILRQSAFPFDSDVSERRRLLRGAGLDAAAARRRDRNRH